MPSDRGDWRVNVRTLVVPLAVATLLVMVAIATQTLSQRSFEQQLLQQLSTVLNADVAALEIWISGHKKNVQVAADDPAFRRSVEQLVSLARRPEGTADRLRASRAAAAVRQQLDRVMAGYDYVSYSVIDGSLRLVAADPETSVGRPVNVRALEYLDRMLRGETVLTRPIPPDTLARAAQGRGDTAYVYVGAPIKGSNDSTIAAVALGIDPTTDFTDILKVARFGRSGETYAFDENGLMISESRFLDTLAMIGLIEPGQSAVLAIQIRDPGGNMVEGFRPEAPQRAWPLTKMAASAVSSAATDDTTTKHDIKGYNDYRGVRVIGAWKWLPEYRFGITTEVDVAEAYRVPRFIQKLLWSIFGLLALTAVGAVIVTVLNRKLQSRVLEARQLGQYKLEKKIGEGGMGTVYRARHALLRRPTAIKLLLPEKATKHAIMRFEREVRHTAKLTSPNTVAIFDYGRTPDGIFYYAMEYLPGLTLSELVDREGALPQSRVLHILKQVAASLAEAHAVGLIHRDVKPSNIILCERGGVFDFTKVLDFGLVREMNQSDTLALTAVGSVAGTPLYLSPEAIDQSTTVDGRIDLYALGAVAYFLLVGDHMFTGNSALEICAQHLNTVPIRPSRRTTNPIDPAFEALVLRLLAKNRDERPDDARALVDELRALNGVAPWTPGEAQAWWKANATLRDLDGAWHVDFAASGPTPTGTVPTLAVDLEGRTSRPSSSTEDRREK